ncbi:DNA repair nuclease APEX1 [Narcine bancroftii]|uniref:DNA repair nuclease APEX1 n=1 Tax=Narcine bancroftii TaxID=1343680 RepID=UPI0038317ED4
MSPQPPFSFPIPHPRHPSPPRSSLDTPPILTTLLPSSFLHNHTASPSFSIPPFSPKTADTRPTYPPRPGAHSRSFATPVPGGHACAVAGGFQDTCGARSLEGPESWKGVAVFGGSEDTGECHIRRWPEGGAVAGSDVTALFSGVCAPSVCRWIRLLHPAWPIHGAQLPLQRPFLYRSCFSRDSSSCCCKMPKRQRKEETEPANKKVRKSSKAKDKAKDNDEAPPTPSLGADFQDTPDQLLTNDGKKTNFKICSWNIDGLRAWVKKNSLEWVLSESPDILCLQETKCSEDQLPPEVSGLSDYPHQYWASCQSKAGYAGVAMMCKAKPLQVTFGIGIEEHDSEGRVITAELDRCYLVTSYVPNSGRGLVRLEYRKTWDEDFRAYLKGLENKKPVVLCGDLNVAHQEIDLKNPKTNKKNAGFTVEEREGFGKLLSQGLVDSFRHLNPQVPHAYTFWTFMGNCRAKNVGWRLDYFLLSQALLPHLCDSKIRSKVLGSDHCPVTLLLAL